MLLRRSPKQSIRYSVFIGVLAGSVFSGSGAFGIDLASISVQVAANEDITLEANAIYVAGDPLEAGFQGSTYFGTYTGTLSGNGATITGLTVPLFGIVSGEVKDLNLATETIQGVVGNGALANNLLNSGIANNVTVTGKVGNEMFTYVGGLVGTSSGSINNSSVSANVSGYSSVGGLVGESYGTITNSNATGNVTGEFLVGGLVGESYGEITGSWYTTGTVIGNEFVGGLVGLSEGDITESYARGGVEGFTSVGGLVGESQGLISASSATGVVTGDFRVGGLVGLLNGGDIVDSHAHGNVTGNENVGGLAGEIIEATITSSHAYGNVTGDYVVGGLVGFSEGTIELSTAPNTESSVQGISNIGGLVGRSNGDIRNSHAKGMVYGEELVGGLVGTATGDITGSYAEGDVLGLNDNIGGLVGDLGIAATITNSYARGDARGDDNIGGLVGYQNADASITNSYATGNVTAAGTGSNGDAGGLVGDSEGSISNSHASGDVSGDFDIGGLVGDLQNAGSITNSYATGNVRATGTDGNWSNGWGGLVGESSGFITNSYATGNVLADYNYGSLIGFLSLDDGGPMQIVNSFATGSTSRANNDVTLDYEEPLMGFGGFVGCAIGYSDDTYNCYPAYQEFPETAPSVLSVVNTEGTAGAPAFEIVACKNNRLPLLSVLIASYTNTCPSNLTAALVSAVQAKPKFNLLESTTLRLFLYLAGDDAIRITVEDFVVLGVNGVNKTNLPVLLKLLKEVELFTLDLNTINKNVKIANELLKKKKKK